MLYIISGSRNPELSAPHGAVELNLLFQTYIALPLKRRAAHSKEYQIAATGVGNSLGHFSRNADHIAGTDRLRRRGADLNPALAADNDVALGDTLKTMPGRGHPGLDPRAGNGDRFIPGIICGFRDKAAFHSPKLDSLGRPFDLCPHNLILSIRHCIPYDGQRQ